MAADDAGERTEAPTPRRLQEAREEGQVARSADLTAAIVLLAGLTLLDIYGQDLFLGLLELVREFAGGEDSSVIGLDVWLRRAIYALVMLVGPILGLLLLVTASGGLLQTGALISLKLLTPKIEHLDPNRGLKRLFSTDSLSRLGFGLLKMSFVAAVGYTSVMGRIGQMLGAGQLGLLALVQSSAAIIYSLALRMALILLILGIADYFYQRWKLNKSLRMTKQEIRDELKRMDGDPLLKQRRRQAQMKIAQQRLRVDVPRADVIVTNPTEYAVALQYDESSMAAPRVVAKGRDFLALQIRLIASEHGIPIVQRPPLARGLYAAVEVGEEVPPMYYKAVAELLAYVYQLSGRAAATA